MDLDELKEFLSVLLGGFIVSILFMIILAVPTTGIVYLISKKECIETAKKLNYNPEFSFWAGCIVTDTNNNKFPLEQLRQIKED